MPIESLIFLAFYQRKMEQSTGTNFTFQHLKYLRSNQEGQNDDKKKVQYIMPRAKELSLIRLNLLFAFETTDHGLARHTVRLF